MSQVHVGNITPVPTEEEAVAIAAAVTMVWPRPVAATPVTSASNTSWRFSGRWWATDPVSRRIRPGA